MTAYFYTNKYFFPFLFFFAKKCTIDFYRLTMMSLSEMHNMVTRAYSHRSITVYIKVPHVKKSCTMHRSRVNLDNLYNMPIAHPLSHNTKRHI